MGKILVIGNFCFDTPVFNGQTQKSRDYYLEFCKHYGDSAVSYIDTEYFRKNPIKSYLNLISSLKRAENVILLLGANAAKFIVPIVARYKKKYNFNLLWSVVGGSLMYESKAKKKLLPHFSKIDSIYFETKTMVDHFTEMGYSNILYAPVFSERRLNGEFNPNRNDGILHFCTYSRVCKEKGITDAINAVKRINFETVKCTLDIYGEPSKDYESELNDVMRGAEDYIKLNDYLRGDCVIDILSRHDAMIFPTFYNGEGFPIGVVECYLGGVPVIASNWHYNSEIVINEETGFIFEVGDVDAIVAYINYLLENRDEGLRMRRAAYEYSKRFLPSLILKDFFDRIDNHEVKNV